MEMATTIKQAGDEILNLRQQRDDLLAVCKFGEMLRDKYFESGDDTEFQTMLEVFNLKVKQAIASTERKQK